MTPLRWTALAVGVLFIALGGTVMWVLNSESGARQVAGIATDVLAGKLTIGEVRGTLVGPLTINEARYQDPEIGVDVRVKSVTVDVALAELLSRRVHVLALDIGGVDVALSEPTKPKPDEPSQFSLQPPIDVVLDRLTLNGARITNNGEELLVARRLDAAGRWTSDGIAIQHFDLDAEQGNVHLTGEVNAEDAYVGKAVGRFKWRLADTDFAGAVQLDSDSRQAKLNLKLSAPFTAVADAVVAQEKTAAWQLDLRVPEFDPRDSVLPDGSIESLALTLKGHGDRETADVRADISINGQQAHVDPLRVAWRDQVLTIEALTVHDPKRTGQLNASGSVRFDTPPFHADLKVNWRNVELPPEWVGQPLSTRGDLVVKGNNETFDARGDLVVGPKGRPANITLAANGTPEQVKVERFEIVQKDGNLLANGIVNLQPQISWKLSAEARRFDPGALLAGWSGRLGFKIQSDGRIEAAGPSATLLLDELSGTLRGRQLSGKADLKLSPNKVVAGEARLRSGASSVHLTGEAGEALDVSVHLDIASLDDWLPDSQGRLSGDFDVVGRWPEVTVKGGARGSALGLADSSVQSVDLEFDINNPLQPSGTARLDASALVAAGFDFHSLSIDAKGSEADHTISLNATSDQLNADVRVQGTRKDLSWTGTIQALSLSAPTVANVALQSPAQVSITPDTFSISESCLAGENISLCVSAQRLQTGELSGRYAIQNFPLPLIVALTKPDLPYRVAGSIEGKGELRRTPEGAVFGQAEIGSASGRISQSENVNDELLSYQNLRITATLAGETAKASAAASLSNEGRLTAEASLSGLTSASPMIDGTAQISVADLSIVEVFAPQLANVSGRAEARIAVSGPLADPKITGQMDLRDLATEVPEVGLQLKNGTVTAQLTDDMAMSVKGAITSGDGQLTFDGGGPDIDAVQINIQGKEFLAVNIPGARVIVTPDLKFARSSERMDLTGKVFVPRADIDLTKLPQANEAVKASPDVVVIEDEVANSESAKSVPLHANLTVELGEHVKLVGFGLNAMLTGLLTVRENPGETTVGSGEIRVTGTYKAYGQDLTIERGRLSFAGTALDDPIIDLVAVRKLQTVTPKLSVTGTASRPVLNVSADPQMSQTQALSYLVTGKPIDQVGQGEGDIVQSAAQSLGGAAGNLLSKSLGKRLGVDEIGVENSDEIGGSAFTVGQYLSPRLYLSYGVGLFEPGEVVKLRYDLSEKISVEASQGPKDQRAGINYRVEK